MEYCFMIPSVPSHIGTPASGRPTQRQRFWGTSHLQKIKAQTYIEQQFPLSKPLDVPIHLDIIFYLPYPNTQKAREAGKVHGNYHFTRPDLLNMIMFVEAVCQGIIFVDDSKVASVAAAKVYDDNPRTEFRVELIGEREREK